MDRLESDLFRENIKIAPLSLRIASYLIDIIVLSLVITIFFSQADQERLVVAKETIERTYSMQSERINLGHTPDNSAMLEEMRVASKQAFETMLLYMAIYIGLEIVYYFICVYYFGATFGQIIVRIRVVDSRRFDKPPLQVCMKRALTKCIFGAVLYFGFIMAFLDRFYRALHDRMSNTIVVMA